MNSISVLTRRSWILLPMSLLIGSVMGCRGESSDQKKTDSESVLGTTEVSSSESTGLIFELKSPSVTGVTFMNKLTETPEVNVLTYQYFHNGGGVAVGDINNDGLPDIYFSSNLYPNELYLNKGNFQFENINPIAKATGDRGWATGVTMVDINNDGLLDIYACKSGNVDPDMRRNKLYVNQGNLKFVEQSAKYGLDDPSYSTQAYFLDYDKDGDLDMYLLNHSIVPMKAKSDNVNLEFERDPKAGDKFFENREGRFVDVSEEAGIKGSPIGFGLSVSVGDVNLDGYPDLYVCNDYLERDYLYINNQKKGFVDELKSRTNHISNFSMGSDVADLNNDGNLDFMIMDMAAKDNYRSKTNMSGMDQKKFEMYVDHGLHYQYMINTLQLNKGDGTFSEVAQLAGVDKTDWSWSALFMDVNQDGDRDLYVTNGLRKEARNNDFVKKKKAIIQEMQKCSGKKTKFMKKIIDKMPSQKIPNLLFVNNGNLNLKDVSNSGLETPSFSNGAAYGDFDGDGDLDIVVNNIDQNAFVYCNNSKSQNYLAVKFNGKENNINGIGCRIKLISENGEQVGEHYLSRGYQSSSYNKVHFGLGDAKVVDSLIVDWPNGKTSVYTQIDVNQTFIAEENYLDIRASLTRIQLDELPTKLTVLPFEHKENDFDDFEREVLLPHKMSEMGPALASGDLNNDGRADFYIGGAKGQLGRLFLQNKSGNFTMKNSLVIQKNEQAEETVCEFVDIDGDQDLDIFIGAGGNESSGKDLKDYLFINTNGHFTLSNQFPENLVMSTGTVAFNDFDQDGDVDVFIGNRQTPGKYPEASPSVLLENKDGVFMNVSNTIAPQLDKVGMVSSAIWSDIDGDGIKELILAGEWMPIKVLKWKGGKMVDISSDLGLSNSEGWWYSLKLADIDNDGDPDILAGNLGLNYKYKATNDYPFGLFYGDMNKDGKSDIVLSYEQNGKYFPLRGRQCSSQQMPEITKKFPSYDLFGKSTVDDVYKGQLDSNKLLLVYDFNSSIFINENGRFTRQNFPHNEQYFNWNSMEVLDINSDGNLDIVVAGNLYEAEVETPRGDAGNGLVLLGDGTGSFEKQLTSDRNWGNSNVKNLKLIMVDGKQAVLIGSSNAKLKLITF